MAGTTSIHALRYPTGGDPATIHTDMKNLADDIDARLAGYGSIAEFQSTYENASQGTEKGLNSGASLFDQALTSTALRLVHIDPDRFGAAPRFRLVGAAMIGSFTTARVPTLALRKVSSFAAGVPTLAAAAITVALPSVAAADTVYEAEGTAAALTSGLWALTCSTPGALHASADLLVWAQLQVRAS